MNGFIYFTKTIDGEYPNPERIAPIIEGSVYDLKSFDTGGYLLSWGHACGDTWVVARGNKAIIILSGYIVEFKSGPDFKSQEEAASYLLDQFICADSDIELQYLLNRTYGSFGIVFRDQVRDITICVTDRVSSRPLWQSRQGPRWIISSHVAAIALSIQSASFDLAGLGAFLLYGGPIQPTRSLYKGVSGIPPGSIVRLDSKGEYLTHQWYQFKHCEDAGLSISEWSELVASRLLHAAARIGRHCQKPAVFFSGGVDSRLAAAAMKSSGNNPLLVTLSDSPNLEVRVAQLASKSLGLDHTVIIRDRYWYLRGLPSAIYETGGTYLWRHGHFSAAAAKIHKNYGADVFLLGDFCEAFSKLCCSLEREKIDTWDIETFTKMFDSIRLPLYRPNDREATLKLFNVPTRNEIKDALRSEIEHRFKEICPLACDPLIVGDLCFRWESVNSMPTFFMFLDLRSMAAERNLMFDADVLQLLEKLPSKMRDENNLGASVIRRLQPWAALVMNSNSLLPMLLPPTLHKMTKRIKPTFGKLRRILLGNSHRTTGSWSEHSVLYASDPQWRGCFDRTINNNDLFNGEIFDLRAIRQSWNDLVNGKNNTSSDVEKLVQLGLSSQMVRNGATSFVRDSLAHKIP